MYKDNGQHCHLDKIIVSSTDKIFPSKTFISSSLYTLYSRDFIDVLYLEIFAFVYVLHSIFAREFLFLKNRDHTY